MKIVGIDPGLYGAIACWEDGKWHNTIQLPIIEIKKGRNELDLVNLALIIRQLILAPDVHQVIIEHPPIIPGNGVLAYCSLFRGWGEIRGIIKGLRPFVSILQPSPQAWKKVVLAGTAKDKEAAIHHVRTTYPTITIPPHPKPPKKGALHDGVADAVCLVEYGLKQLTQVQSSVQSTDA